MAETRPGEVVPERKIGVSASSDAMLAEMERLYCAPGVHLYALTDTEATLIELLRGDPDQNEHLAGLGDGTVTVRHPLIERLRGDLFTCPALESATEVLGGVSDREGRYRWTPEGFWVRVGA